jgi:hypothetical protein
MALTCRACGADNPAGKKFCGDCGTALENRCPQCGADNPANKKFCGECGAALKRAGSPEPGALSRVQNGVRQPSAPGSRLKARPATPPSTSPKRSCSRAPLSKANVNRSRCCSPT